MNFREAESYLFSLGNEVETMKLGLDNIRKLLAALGNPQDNYLKVQVAGTNGKGSVCAFLDSICLRAGIKTGVFTSPHLVSITERIRVSGIDIADDDFARHATAVRDTAERMVAKSAVEYTPTFFEQITAIALLTFKEARVEVAILETGLGGRLDATTAANAEIAAITRIDYDHREYLGNTIEEIAAQKAAIITEETRDVVIGCQSKNIMAILRKRCSEFGVVPINDGYDPWRLLPDVDETVRVSLTRQVFPAIRLGLAGHHQIENAQTAIQIVEALLYHGLFWDLDEEKENRIIDGLKKARHPGRLEHQGRYLFDGAHNIGGAKALRAYLDVFVDEPVTLIFGAMNDKDVGEMAAILFPKANRVVLTQADNLRAMSVEQLVENLPPGVDKLNVMTTASAADALSNALEFSDDGDVIVVTGSLYLVGEVKALLSREAESEI